MDNDQNVIFHEGGIGMGPKLQMARKPAGEKTDRIVNLIRKISGGRIQSQKTATIIVLAAVAAMLVISMIWLIQAFSGPSAPPPKSVPNMNI